MCQKADDNGFLRSQLQNPESLREIADDVKNNEFQRKLGFSSISAAQLCRKHNQVDPSLLQRVFEQLIAKVLSYSTSSAKRSTMKVIDSTTVSLCLQAFRWATFRKTKVGIKLHLWLAFVDADEIVPERVTITEAKKNDRTQMDALIHEEGITYVFERGY